MNEAVKEFDRVIIGIDPGTNLMGYGILGVRNKKPVAIALGVIELSKFQSHYYRLGRIFPRDASENSPDDIASGMKMVLSHATKVSAMLDSVWKLVL